MSQKGFRREMDLGLPSTDAKVHPSPEEETKATEKAQYENRVTEEVRLRLDVERATAALRDEMNRRSPTPQKKCVHGMPVTVRLDAKGDKLNYVSCGLCTRQVMTDEQLAAQPATTSFTARKG